MKRHMNDAQHNRHLEQQRPGLLRQEFTSYERSGKIITKKTIIRTYLGTNHYTDSYSSEVISNE